MKTLAIAFSILAIASHSVAQTFTVNAVTHCPEFATGYNISLQPGTYHIEYVSGAISWFPDDSYQGGYTWQSQVQLYVYATAQGGTIGDTGIYTSAALAEAAAQGIYVLSVAAASVVSFHIVEIGPDPSRCADNRGSITLRFVAPLKTEPTTWGKVKALYRR